MTKTKTVASRCKKCRPVNWSAKWLWRSEGDVCQNLSGMTRVLSGAVDPNSAMFGKDGSMNACRVYIGLRHRLGLFDENCKMFECRRACNLKRTV